MHLQRPADATTPRRAHAQDAQDAERAPQQEQPDGVRSGPRTAALAAQDWTPMPPQACVAPCSAAAAPPQALPLPPAMHGMPFPIPMHMPFLPAGPYGAQGPIALQWAHRPSPSHGFAGPLAAPFFGPAVPLLHAPNGPGFAAIYGAAPLPPQPFAHAGVPQASEASGYDLNARESSAPPPAARAQHNDVADRCGYLPLPPPAPGVQQVLSASAASHTVHASVSAQHALSAAQPAAALPAPSPPPPPPLPPFVFAHQALLSAPPTPPVRGWPLVTEASGLASTARLPSAVAPPPPSPRAAPRPAAAAAKRSPPGPLPARRSPVQAPASAGAAAASSSPPLTGLRSSGLPSPHALNSGSNAISRRRLPDKRIQWPPGKRLSPGHAHVSRIPAEFLRYVQPGRRINGCVSLYDDMQRPLVVRDSSGRQWRVVAVSSDKQRVNIFPEGLEVRRTGNIRWVINQEMPSGVLVGDTRREEQAEDEEGEGLEGEEEEEEEEEAEEEDEAEQREEQQQQQQEQHEQRGQEEEEEPRDEESAKRRRVVKEESRSGGDGDA